MLPKSKMENGRADVMGFCESICIPTYSFLFASMYEAIDALCQNVNDSMTLIPERLPGLKMKRATLELNGRWTRPRILIIEQNQFRSRP